MRRRSSLRLQVPFYRKVEVMFPKNVKCRSLCCAWFQRGVLRDRGRLDGSSRQMEKRHSKPAGRGGATNIELVRARSESSDLTQDLVLPLPHMGEGL